MAESKSTKKMFNMAYGLGASIVIIGALFKILHWEIGPLNGGILLAVGLITEALIFAFSAFEPVEDDLDWSLVYPELTFAHLIEEGQEIIPAGAGSGGGGAIGGGNGDAVSQKLDEMLADANIGEELIESLGAGLRSFESTAQNLNNSGDASAATESLVGSLTSASKNVDMMSDAYSKASESLAGITDLKGEGTSYAEQLTTMTKNLGELNGVYEQQIVANNSGMKLSSDIQENINELLTNLSDSVEDTKRYKTEISSLGENLGKLNTVYGNMLSAMTIQGGQA